MRSRKELESRLERLEKFEPYNAAGHRVKKAKIDMILWVLEE